MMKIRTHKHNYLVQLNSLVRHDRQHNNEKLREYNCKIAKQLNVPKYKGTKYRGFNNYIVKAGVFKNYE